MINMNVATIAINIKIQIIMFNLLSRLRDNNGCDSDMLFFRFIF